MKTIMIYMVGWSGMAALAIANGALRERVYGKSLSDLSAHQVSTLIALILFGLYIYIITGIFRLETASQAAVIGCIWLFMTISFEFVFGHYIAGHSWSRLLHDYNLLQGRVWILVLLWTTVAPYAFHKIRS